MGARKYPSLFFVDIVRSNPYAGETQSRVNKGKLKVKRQLKEGFREQFFIQAYSLSDRQTKSSDAFPK